MQRAVNRLLRRPQLRRHLWYLARFVCGNEFLCIFEAGRRGEEGSVARLLVMTVYRM